MTAVLRGGGEAPYYAYNPDWRRSGVGRMGRVWKGRYWDGAAANRYSVALDGMEAQIGCTQSGNAGEKAEMPLYEGNKEQSSPSIHPGPFAGEEDWVSTLDSNSS